MDKAGIIKHKNKILENNARNQFHISNFEKYTVSPKDKGISKIEGDVNF